MDLIPSMTWDGGPQNHAFCSMPSRRKGGRAGGSPGPALGVGVADEAERREPLVALVVGGLDLAGRLFRRVRQVEAAAPDHVLPELLSVTVAQAGRLILAHHVVEDLLAV